MDIHVPPKTRFRPQMRYATMQPLLKLKKFAKTKKTREVFVFVFQKNSIHVVMEDVSKRLMIKQFGSKHQLKVLKSMRYIILD